MQRATLAATVVLLLFASTVAAAQSVPKDNVYTVVKETRGTKPTWTVIYSGHPASGKTPSSPKIRYILEFSNECLSKDSKKYDCDHRLEVGQTFGYYDFGFGSPTTAGNQTIVKVDERADEFMITEVRNNDPSQSVIHLYKIVRVEPSNLAQSASAKKDIPTIAKLANQSIVSIVMSDKNGNPIAQGSGFLATNDGLIVTNYHVISEGSSAVAKLPDGAFYAIDGVLNFEKARDVAVIKAHGKSFKPVVLGDSDRVQVGEEVVAIGSPLSLESTVSNGIVSAVRTIADQGGKFLQITAPISPGSSGGPLFNMAGEVVGITTMYVKGGENLNFAIPVNDAKSLLRSLSAIAQKFPDEREPKEAEKSAENGDEDDLAHIKSYDATERTVVIRLGNKLIAAKITQSTVCEVRPVSEFNSAKDCEPASPIAAEFVGQSIPTVTYMMEHPNRDRPYRNYLIGPSTYGSFTLMVTIKAKNGDHVHSEVWDIQKTVEANP